MLQGVNNIPIEDFKGGLNTSRDIFSLEPGQSPACMNVEFIDIVEDMNKFLEEMSYAICFSKKEAFSYVIAEGMCKGLKPIIHNFYGAEAIWDKQYIWNTIDEAIEMVTGGDYTPYIYRKYIEENYPIKLMLERIYNVIKS